MLKNNDLLLLRLTYLLLVMFSNTDLIQTRRHCQGTKARRTQCMQGMRNDELTIDSGGQSSQNVMLLISLGTTNSKYYRLLLIPGINKLKKRGCTRKKRYVCYCFNQSIRRDPT